MILQLKKFNSKKVPNSDRVGLVSLPKWPKFMAYDTWDRILQALLEATAHKTILSRLDCLRAKCTWCDGLGVSGRASHRQAQGVGLLGWVCGLVIYVPFLSLFLVKNIKVAGFLGNLMIIHPPFSLKVMSIVKGDLNI